MPFRTSSVRPTYGSRWSSTLRFSVARWSLVAYVIIAAMIEYAFLRNNLSGGPLVVLTLSLAVFAVHVPMLVGFTVARFHGSTDLQAEAPTR